MARKTAVARDSIRDSIDRIEFTDFQLHELTGRWLSENMPEGFKSDRFRILSQNHHRIGRSATEGSDGEIRIKPNLYILVWEPSFYEELLTRDYFLPVPTRDPETAYLGASKMYSLLQAVWRVVILIACY
ncbi:DUF3346 domain-containing protein [Vibrio lentus]|nr:DUF3346 domain-containing protein [Vibrio lentus]